MATFVSTAARAYLNGVDFSGRVDTVDFGTLERVMVRNTTMNDGGYECVLPGIASGEARLSGPQDYGGGFEDQIASMWATQSDYALNIYPAPTGAAAVAAGDTAWFSRGVLSKDSPIQGAKGDLARWDASLAYDTAIVQGKVATPLTTQTGNGNGSAVALAGPTAAQKLYAALHVTAYSGFTNVVFKIQSDDSSGFPSPTDRITFTTVTAAPNGQFASVAGPFSSETHHRITWTVTGSGSVSFTAAFGVV